ncbi:2-hydroxyhepta-2,4-diene-1,7-dioate isomerase 2 [Bacillus sp. OxB-1]|nr:2-hydroxyhepta-2,4-diene-1,7-dioate isomerase 2 [Bacillus sp. OxB-1]
MRLVMFTVNSSFPHVPRLGSLHNHQIIDLAAGYRSLLLVKETCDINAVHQFADLYLPNDMKRFLEGGELSLHAAREALQFATTSSQDILNHEKLSYHQDEVNIHAPISNPPTIRDFISFEEHYRNSLKADVPQVWYDIPVYYKSVASTLIGPNATCHWPAYSEVMDYELEFACIIGKRGKDIPVEQAKEHIAGYFIYNDFSARDMQLREMEGKLGPAKGKDFCTAIGPYLVTADEVPDPYNMEMTAKVNGEIWSKGNTNTMFRTFEEIIAYVSQSETLVPGDIFGSGTVGNGCGLELGKFLKNGDVIELEVGNLGVLKNKVVTQQ